MECGIYSVCPSSNQRRIGGRNSWTCVSAGSDYVWFCDSAEQSGDRERASVETGAFLHPKWLWLVLQMCHLMLMLAGE
jgi:hypothetical protein